MQKKRIAALGIAAAVVALVAGGSLAYFTDTTETVDNTFTIGDVAITLDEGKYDSETGEFDEKTRVIENDYGVLMPGSEVDKDPTVHVDENSQPAWLFVSVEMTKWKSLAMMYAQLNGVDPSELTAADIEAIANTYIEGIEWDDWTVMNADDLVAAITAGNTEIEIILGHNDVVNAAQNIEVFTGIKIPAGITSEMAEEVPNFICDPDDPNRSYKIHVTASAIQEANIDTLADAYDALFGVQN